MKILIFSFLLFITIFVFVQDVNTIKSIVVEDYIISKNNIVIFDYLLGTGSNGNIIVDKNTYYKYNIGDNVTIEIAVGSISGIEYFKNIR